MEKFNLKDFLTKDGPEFILCSICANNRSGKCLCADSMANSEHPQELYLNICKGFKSNPYPITPSQFEKLMRKIGEGFVDEPDCECFTNRDISRYQMERMMCIMLEQLGYGEGASVFLNKGFELPF